MTDETVLPASMHASDALLHKLFDFEGKVGYHAELAEAEPIAGAGLVYAATMGNILGVVYNLL
jgi:hypothetical protein